jgi:hypothetical protein
MSFDPTYNVNNCLCFRLLEEIFDLLNDIRLILELDEDLTLLLDPPFDPFRTTGKY